ncbi:glycosyltransferase family 4 protein [Lusitaniella coriacea]|uniref:glycosyltransferase family 4 protein n=1 Tax=Lusitaniella coriacea TaxID=1983105 RepID=UPI003CF8019B
MKILYDGTIYKFQAAGGVNRYFENIINRLPESFQPILTTSHLNNVNYPRRRDLKIHCYYKFGLRPNRVLSFLEPYYFRSKTFLSQPDLIHPTYYSLLTQKAFSAYQCPMIITVYDMIHEHFPEQLDPDGQQIEQKRKAILDARVLLCISENTKQDLLECYPEVEEKVRVTYLAADIDVSAIDSNQSVPESPYFIYVGGRWGYKNFNGLLRAFGKVASVCSDVMLCVVGSPFNAAEEQFIADLKLRNRVRQYGHIDDRALATLYRHSVALVYPSLYEGFGIPLLEAMSCGTAVVASDCSSIPEVVGEAGILFNPNATGDLADILLFLLDNPIERDRLIAKGYKRAKLFNWDKTVAQTLDAYRSLL